MLRPSPVAADTSRAVSAYGSRVVVAALAGLAGAVLIVGFQLLRRGSTPPAAPPVLGSLFLVDDKGIQKQLDDVRRNLKSGGIRDAVVGVYTSPGTTVSVGGKAFVLITGKTSGPVADIGAELRNEAAVFGSLSLGNHFASSGQTIAGVTYTCATFAAGPDSETTCVWQTATRVLFGVGENITAADTANLVSLARADLNIAG